MEHSEKVIPKTTKFAYVIFDAEDWEGFGPPEGVYTSIERAKGAAQDLWGIKPKDWAAHRAPGDMEWSYRPPRKRHEYFIRRFSLNDIGYLES